MEWIVMTTNPPRERGRPSLPKDEQKAKINITIDKDVLDWIDSHGTNRSRFVNKILKQASQAPRE
jgi:uncharacterized protein (DUF4415 family)